jgi:hypothetical protein
MIIEEMKCETNFSYFPDELVLNYQPEKFMAYLKPTPEK